MKTVRHTVIVRGPLPGQPDGDPPIVLEFYTSGEFVQSRSYHIDQEELIGRRIVQWYCLGKLME